MLQLDPQDAMFAYMESPNAPLQIGWLNIYDPATAPGGRVELPAVLEHVRRRLHTVRFFRQKLVKVPANLDQPYWIEDDGFDLEYHVNYAALPAPGDWRQLRTLVARLFARPFDFTKPLWEFYVIEGLEAIEGYPPGSFAILAKIHHAAVDGVSGNDVTTFLHTLEPDTPPPTVEVWQPEVTPGTAEMLVRAYLSRVSRPRSLIKTVIGAVPGIKRVRAAIGKGELRKPDRVKVPRTPFSGGVGPHRVIEARRIPLEAMRPIRALVKGATVNDVLLALVGGALRHYLTAKHALPEGALVATCPISVRTEEERGQFGNRISNMTVALPTDLADPVERLRRVRCDTGNTKAINEAIGAKTLAEGSQLLPGRLIGLSQRMFSKLALADRLSASANTTVTNVPGPPRPLYFAGARMLSQFGLGTVLDGMGIFHFVLSYCGELTVTVTADRDKLPDPEFYGECLDRSLAELTDAAQAAAATPPTLAAGEGGG